LKQYWKLFVTTFKAVWKKNKGFISLLLAISIVTNILTLFSESKEEITITTAFELIQEARVERALITEHELYLYPNNQVERNVDRHGRLWKADYLGSKTGLGNLLSEQNVPYEYQVSSKWFSTLLPFVFWGLLLWYFYSSARNVSASLHKTGQSGVTFADVAGYDACKEQLGDILSFLKDPKEFKRLGAKVPGGTLFYGPPGTGKTLLAKALAGEVGVPFYSIGGSDFVELFVGVGSARVRDLFKKARQNAPSIIFIDEVDSIGSQRSSGGNSREDTNTLNSLLAEMDGFNENDQVIVIAATNRLEVLDSAFLRPGRFDRKIFVGLPTRVTREAIIKTHARRMVVDEHVDFGKIAAKTSGLSGADMELIVNEAAVLATKSGAASVTQEHFEEAFRVITVGKSDKSHRLNEADRRLVAFHEGGHAFVSAALGKASDIASVSIVPTSNGSLGHNLNTPEEEQDGGLYTRKELLMRVAVLLGGRAAEQVGCQMVTGGAANDLKHANQILHQMILKLGLSELMPNFVRFDEERYLSDESDANVEREMRFLLNALYTWAIELMESHKGLLELFAEELLEQEELSGETLMALLGRVQPKPFTIPSMQDASTFRSLI
jgi:cell division protease FtsH